MCHRGRSFTATRENAIAVLREREKKMVSSLEYMGNEFETFDDLQT